MACATLSGLSPPASISRTPSGAPSASDQSNTDARTGLRGVDQDGVGDSGRRRSGQPGVAGRERLDDERDPPPDEAEVLRRLAAVELGAPEAAVRLTTSITRSGRSLRNTPMVSMSWGQALEDVAHRLGVDLPGAGREHEADGVGAHGHRQQRVVLVGDAADLDEQWASLARRRADRAGKSS